MANTYLTDIDFSATENGEYCGAHIAYTFDFQGGAASGYNKPLMFKGTEAPEVSFEKIEALKALGEDVTELRKSYVGQVMNLLGDELNKKFAHDWDWIYVVDADFDNNNVIFMSDYGIFSVGFTLNGLVVELEDVAQPVIQTQDYQVVEGNVLISVDFFDNLVDDALAGMIKSAIKHNHVKELLIKAKSGTNSVIAEENNPAVTSANTPDINKGDIPLDSINKEEFLKSAEFQDLIKSQIEAAVAGAKAEVEALAEAEINKAKAEAEELRKAQMERIVEDYTTVIKGYGYVEEDKLEVLVKYLIENKDVAETIVASFEKAKEETDAIKAEFAKEHGSSAQNKEPAFKSSSDLITKRAQEMKARSKSN